MVVKTDESIIMDAVESGKRRLPRCMRCQSLDVVHSGSGFITMYRDPSTGDGMWEAVPRNNAYCKKCGTYCKWKDRLTVSVNDISA